MPPPYDCLQSDCEVFNFQRPPRGQIDGLKFPVADPCRLGIGRGFSAFFSDVGTVWSAIPARRDSNHGQIPPEATEVMGEAQVNLINLENYKDHLQGEG